MEKFCTYDSGYSRKEASEAGFCSDCSNKNCPYYNGNSGEKQGHAWSRNDSNPWDMPVVKKKVKVKKKFVKKSYSDDD